MRSHNCRVTSRKRGVIAASAGNHAQALAYQGRFLGIPATVVMPKIRAAH